MQNVLNGSIWVIKEMEETNGQIKRPPIRVAGCDYQE
nr:MAG TPA: hypothetical protein [Caudoviricetes sp.]